MLFSKRQLDSQRHDEKIMVSTRLRVGVQKFVVRLLQTHPQAAVEGVALVYVERRKEEGARMKGRRVLCAA